MQAETFLKQLSITRLKNTAVVDTNQPSGIKANFLEAIIDYVNESLTNLYSEFYLLKKSALIKIVQPYTEYYLRSKYAVSDPTVVPHKYILDTSINPFYPYLIRITNVFDEYGYEMLVNDQFSALSLNTISFDKLEFNHIHKGSYFTVVYLADHIPISLGSISTDSIELPPIMFEMLKHLVAGKYYSDLGKNSAEAQNNLMQYMNLSAKVIKHNLVPDFQSSNQHLEDKGFV